MENELENVVEETTVDTIENVEEAAGETTEVVEEFTDTIEEAQETPLQETVVEFDEQPKTFTQEQVNGMITKRLERERRKLENNYKPLVSTLKEVGFDSDNPLEITNKLKQSYEEQGFTFKDPKDTLSEREQQYLAKAEADEIIELGEDVMKETFIDLYSKKERTPREEHLMYLISKENSLRVAKKDLLEVGADPKIIEDPKFVNFGKRYASNVSVKEIYKDYQKINGASPTKPVSAGSIKDNNNSLEVKEFYTSEEVDKLTDKDLDNPKIFEAVKKSMLKW